MNENEFDWSKVKKLSLKRCDECGVDARTPCVDLNDETTSPCKGRAFELFKKRQYKRDEKPRPKCVHCGDELRHDRGNTCRKKRCKELRDIEYQRRRYWRNPELMREKRPKADKVKVKCDYCGYDFLRYRKWAEKSSREGTPNCCKRNCRIKWNKAHGNRTPTENELAKH